MNTSAIELPPSSESPCDPTSDAATITARGGRTSPHAGGRRAAIRAGIVGQVCGTLTSSIGILKGVSAPSRGPLIEVSLPPTRAVGGCTLGPPRVDGKVGRRAGGERERPRDDRHPGGDPDLIQRTMIKHRRCVLSCRVYTRSNCTRSIAVSSCAVFKWYPGMRANIGKSC